MTSKTDSLLKNFQKLKWKIINLSGEIEFSKTGKYFIHLTLLEDDFREREAWFNWTTKQINWKWGEKSTSLQVPKYLLHELYMLFETAYENDKLYFTNSCEREEMSPFEDNTNWNQSLIDDIFHFFESGLFKHQPTNE